MRTTVRRMASMLAVLAVVAASVSLPHTTWADPEPVAGHGRGERDEHLSGELLLRASNLTAEQSARVRTILTAHRTAMRSVFMQLRQAQTELSDRLNGAAPVDPAALQPQIKRIGELQEQILQDRVHTMTEIRALLGADQLAKVQQARDRLKQIRLELRQLFHDEWR